MVEFEDATDEELIAIAERYPAEFAPENIDRWSAYFEALEGKHLEAGLERAVAAADTNGDMFSWLMGAFVSRLTNEPLLRVLDRFESVVADSTFVKLVESASTFAVHPETRRTVRTRYDSMLQEMADGMRRGIELQFEESPTEFRREWLRGWVTEYRSSISYLTRCSVLHFDRDSNTSVHIWAHGVPLRYAEPTDELVSMFRNMYDETQSYYDRDEPLDLYKGTTFERTIASSAESWTDDRTVAEAYDGYSVYEREIDPESVLFSYEVVTERANVYTSHAKNTFVEDSEYVVFGGEIE